VSAQPAARVVGLTKRYGDNVALSDVDLEVAPGELRGLLGPNGAGKTTLLRALFGLIRPDAGSVELLGHALGFPHTLAAGEAVPLDGVAGFVEEPAFYPYLTGSANLELLAQMDDAPPPDIGEVLDRVGLAERGHRRVATYSTGMRQRLGIAAALLRQPRLLLLDEPTSGLDPAGAQAVSKLLRELAASGVAVILSSHLIGELEALCHSYTILRDGRVVWDGSAASLDAQAPGSAYALSTSDDSRALELARLSPGVRASRADEGLPLRLIVETGRLEEFVLALGREGVAVLRLELLVSPLKAMFFALTGGDGESTAQTPAAQLEALAQVAAPS
jgi:ABC-2 type transport system ATP-binding protein